MKIRRNNIIRLLGHHTRDAWCIALIASTALLVTATNWQSQSQYTTRYAAITPPADSTMMSSPLMSPSAFKAFPLQIELQGKVLPYILSSKDIITYRAISQAQKSADWARADQLIQTLKNKILVGHILSARYLHPTYKSSPKELTQWLDQYSDHPQAKQLYRLALRKQPSLKNTLPVIRKRSSLSGYGDSNKVHSGSQAYNRMWKQGLGAWKTGRIKTASRLFSKLAQQPHKLSPWMASAAAYWSYRAYDKLGKNIEATHYLELAAENPRSFYGIIASKQLGRPLDLHMTPVTLTEADVLEIIGIPAIRRTIALTEAGMEDIADKELRAYYPRTNRKERQRILALAHELNMPSIQVTMAVLMRNDKNAMDFASYPIPDWKPQGGFTVDPALLYALMRQESGFRVSAVSPVGALGLMQLMPSTAKLMKNVIAKEGVTVLPQTSVTEPVMNITLGQGYLQHLMKTKVVEGNLFYLLTAYNAGPGRLGKWKRRLNYKNDPLLFVESIPYVQTRQYVMHVMSNYWIYSELTGQDNFSLHALVNNDWPWYEYAKHSSSIFDVANLRP